MMPESISGSLRRFNASVLEAILLNEGIKKAARTIASTREIKVKTIDSVRNCSINPFLDDPTTLRIPTSSARPADFAVARFMKLMEAITIRKKAAILYCR